LLIELAGTGVCAAAGFTAWAVRGCSSAVFAPSVHHGPRGRKAMALTFDDGPSEGTPAVLEELRRHGVSATFFLCGANVRRVPGVAREVAAAGHEIGNHGDTHRPLYFKSREFIYQDMAHAQETIAETTGRTPRFFRAPFGARWFGLREAQRRLSLLGVMWTVLGLDWKLPPAKVAARVLGDAASGGILCLHDGRETAANPDISATLDAVRLIVPELLSQGYRLETVSGLLGHTGRNACAT
jgi:peptidoglycan/xylan/chitin deacetylase (PgdA/CDA1 family)